MIAMTESVEDLCELARRQFGDALSDIQLDIGYPPTIVVDGKSSQMDDQEAVTSELINSGIEHLSEFARSRYTEELDADGRFKMRDGGIVRMHAYVEEDGPALSLRLQPPQVRPWETVGLPNHLLDLFDRPNGLVIFCGQVRSGKTTVIHSAFDHINRTASSPKIFYTIEDPPEFRHERDRATFHAREIGVSAKTYTRAIEGALRVKHDYMLIGEWRNRETMEAGIQAALLSSLVFTTIHTNGVEQTLQRVVQSFDGDRQAEIKAALAQTLLAIVYLRLVPATNGKEVLAYEIVRITDQTRALLEKPLQFKDSLDDKEGMITLERCLSNFVDTGVITREVAERNANEPKRLKFKVGT